MSVKVTTGNGGTEIHESADDYFLKDGHLFVTKGNRGYEQNVAIYTPNRWTRAEVVQDKD